MSLHINVDKITQVLLADGWHDVSRGTFVIDAYEFMDAEPDSPDHDAFVLLGGGRDGLITSHGFEFVEKKHLSEGGDVVTTGPMTAVLAVRYPAG